MYSTINPNTGGYELPAENRIPGLANSPGVKLCESSRLGAVLHTNI